MDFLDPKKRKNRTRRLYLGYLLVAIAIGLAAYLLLAIVSGYGVDNKGNVIQNGLVFVASNPDAAEVRITNNSNTFKRTVVASERLVLKADDYNFEFLKEGYRPWKRSITLRGGGLQRLVYPFLFPEK